jgi:hypothetical protein
MENRKRRTGGKMEAKLMVREKNLEWAPLYLHLSYKKSYYVGENKNENN